MDATVSCELGGVRRSEWEVVDMGGNINFKVWKWGAAGVGAEVGRVVVANVQPLAYARGSLGVCVAGEGRRYWRGATVLARGDCIGEGRR
jgi:hypothetical protein